MRLRICDPPPHVTLQSPQAFQSDHPPTARYRKETKVIVKFERAIAVSPCYLPGAYNFCARESGRVAYTVKYVATSRACMVK